MSDSLTKRIEVLKEVVTTNISQNHPYADSLKLNVDAHPLGDGCWGLGHILQKSDEKHNWSYVYGLN
jgi:uncharacterized membrane protein